MLDLSKDFSIDLKVIRPEKKPRSKKKPRPLWYYENYSPKRVELSVLDYFASFGYDGYFTEDFNFFEEVLGVFCWESDPSVRDYFFVGGQDDKIADRHAIINRRLSQLTDDEVKTKLKIQSASKKDADHNLAERLWLFYCVVGRECIKDYFSRRWTLERLEMLEEIDYFSSKLSGPFKPNAITIIHKKWPNRTIAPLDKVGGEIFLRRFWSQRDPKFLTCAEEELPPILSPEAYENDLYLPKLSHAAEWSKPEYEDDITMARNLAEYVLDEEYKQKLLHTCDLVEIARKDLLRRYEFAILDLVVWNDKEFAFVEVKAPGDRLFKAQINTIERVRAEGGKACVVSVSEVGGAI